MTMTPDDLRALADALEPMARAPRFEDFDVPGFCAWVRACADAQPVRAVPIGHALSAVRHVGSANYPDRERAAIERLYSAEFDAYAHPAPAAPQAEPCIGNDPICPCQDGDACHYKDSADGTKAWPVPQAEPKRDPLHGLAPTHRCPACGAFWRQCDDASWNLRSTSCCGLCDAGRVELVCWLDEPKREPLSDEQIDVALQTDPEMILALMGGEMTVGEFKSALRRLARAVERAHKIGGSDAE